MKDDNEEDIVLLTDEDKQDIQEELAWIADELAVCRDSFVLRELTQQRDHLQDELAAGRRLPIPDPKDESA